MNEIVIVCIVFIAAFPLTWGMCELIEYVAKICKERGKEVHYVYYSRKLNKTINVDKVGE